MTSPIAEALRGALGEAQVVTDQGRAWPSAGTTTGWSAICATARARPRPPQP